MRTLTRAVVASILTSYTIACTATVPPPDLLSAGDRVTQHSAAVFPETTAGRRFKVLLHAINSGDSVTIRQMAAEHYDGRYLSGSGGTARAQIRWLEIRTIYGPIELDTIVLSAAHEVRGWARGNLTRGWLDFRLVLDSVPPHRILRVGLGRGVRPPHARLRRPPLRDGTSLATHLHTYLQRLAANDLFSGTMLVARDGRPILQEAYGFADQHKKLANRTDTRFDLASIGKMFTAVAIAQLAERGSLSFDDTISGYLPEMPASLTKRITVGQLLNHSSGLGELGPALDEKMARARTVKEMFSLLADTAPSFVPGSQFTYSNRGYIVLGRIVERTSGADYFSYLDENIFKPAGMAETGFYPSEQVGLNQASRYTFYPGLRAGFVPAPRGETTVRMDYRGGPAGGVYSTVLDLHRFVEALLSARVISASSLARLTMARAEYPWGYGFAVSREGTQSFGHAGAAPGASTYLRVYPDLRYTVIVLSNYDAAAGLVGDYIRDLVVPE